MKTNWTGVVGDVGGTHARFALVDDEGHPRHPMTYRARDFSSLTEALSKYLQETAGRKRPPRAVVAVAGPVLDGEIEFTNLDWQVSEGELLAHFEFEAVSLINDFAAQALACPGLQADDLRRNIVSGVIVSVNALANGSAQLLQADEAVRAYKEAIETERLKYKAGSATLLDVINTEDRWIEALITAVAARQQIAEGYARLRFESGTMLPGEGARLAIGKDVLVTVPVAAGEMPFARIPSFRTRTQLR